MEYPRHFYTPYELMAHTYIHSDFKRCNTSKIGARYKWSKLWKRYVDDILEVIKKNTVQDLMDHLNKVDETGSITFTFESVKDNALPFLDMLVVKKPDGHVKFLVYRKQTRTCLLYTSPSPRD